MPSTPNFQSIAQNLAPKLGLSNPVFEAKGAYKETFKAIDKSKNEVALKIFDPNKCNAERSEREINAMKKCDHEFIGKLFGFGKMSIPTAQIVLFSIEEFFNGGTLTDRIKKATLDINDLKKIAVALSKAIIYLKTLDLVHRDIKPDNIMYKADGSPMLVDFGLVRNLSESSLTMSWIPRGPGTPLFSSPEQLNNEKALIDWRSDQFSLGIVLGYCCQNFHPFIKKTEGDAQAVENVSKRLEPPQDYLDFCLQNKLDPLIQMLAPWPIKRFNEPDELINALEGMG